MSFSVHILFRTFLSPSSILLLYLLFRLASTPSLVQLPPPVFPLPHRSLAVYLPISTVSLSRLDPLLAPFLRKPPPYLRELVLLCPEQLLSQIRPRLYAAGTNSTLAHITLSLRPVITQRDPFPQLLKEAAGSTTAWILILDEQGILSIAPDVLQTIWVVPALYSQLTSGSTLHHLNDSRTHTQSKILLKPPFLVPKTVLSSNLHPILNSRNIWSALCHHISDYARAQSHLQDEQHVKNIVRFLFPSTRLLWSAAKTICGFHAQNYSVQISIYDRGHIHTLASPTDWQVYHLGDNCALDVAIHQAIPFVQDVGWIPAGVDNTHILLAILEDKTVLEGFLATVPQYNSSSTRIYLPEADFCYSDWIGSLTIQELANWYIPTITFSIITNNRPHSLQRLLESLTAARYYSDNLSLRINVEQEADEATRSLVENFTWNHGSIQVHHRVIHGGLLPAIVESWYPHGNDSYGLLLEDDVELSPLFYAWIKMNILKYRYGSQANKNPRLYGISLYQQKNLELPINGRQPFNARELFSSNPSLASTPNTPYLSSIPCSWGAVYFPEQWRQFHKYLSSRMHLTRFSPDEAILPTPDLQPPVFGRLQRPHKDPHNVVPNVRSNNWTHSWKKFFIELVYLHGYVMLYPNYPNFVSLSTNHLEVGLHVKSLAVANEKRDLFSHPLMTTPSECNGGTVLLDLPSGRLPNFTDLPVLNLTGSITLLESLVKIGREREQEMQHKS